MVIICIRRRVTASDILVGGNGDRSKSSSAAMVLDSEVEGNIGDSFSLDSDQNCREIETSEVDWVDRVGVGKGGGRVSNEVALPMLKREISDGQGSKRFMFKKEMVVCFIMSLEVHRNFPAKVGAIGDSVLPVKGGGKHCDPGAARGRVKINAFRAAPEVRRLENQLIGGLRRWVNKGIGNVVIVPEIRVRHVDVNIIRPNRDGEVFLIERLELRIRSRQEGVSREGVLLRSQRDESIRSGVDVVLEHELLEVVCNCVCK
jgi:hypothetical protein